MSQTKKNLIDYFSPVFSCGLAIETTLEKTQALPKTCDDVCAEVQKLLEKVEKEALEGGINEAAVREGKFAIVSWLDEIFARYNEWSAGYTPLQVIYFATNNAGNEFFDHLSALTEENDQAREIYYFALSLGFVGEYYHDTGVSGELHRLREIHSRQLPTQLANSGALNQEHVTPQPYLVADPKPKKTKRNYWPYIIALVAGLVVGSIIYYFVTKDPDRGEILQQINSILKEYKCQRVGARLHDDFHVSLKGYVKDNQDQKTIEERIGAIEGVEFVENKMEVYAWPLCEVMGLLHLQTKVSKGNSGEPRIRPMGQNVSYKEGERLVLSITAPDYNSFVYVDYIQKDGTVVHMFPIPPLPDNSMSVGETLVLGEDNPELPQYIVRPPFGLDMVVIYTSPVPVFKSLRPNVEPADSYLDDLRREFVRLKKLGHTNELRSDYFLISTVRDF